MFGVGVQKEREGEGGREGKELEETACVRKLIKGIKVTPASS
jgi:hypothetical protein